MQKEVKEKKEENQSSIKQEIEKLKENDLKRRMAFKEWEIDSEEISIKKLNEEDLEDVIRIMKKAMIELDNENIEELKEVINLNMSYGALVDGLLVAIALAWPIGFDEESSAIIDGDNALFMDNIIILRPYERKGIREMLIKAREKEAKMNNYEYCLTLLKPEESRKEQKIYSLLNYTFIDTDEGIIAYKILK